MTDERRVGAPGAATPDIGAPWVPVRERCMTVKRGREAVLRVLRGEPLETVARDLRLRAGDPGGWRDAFPKPGMESLHARPREDRDARIARPGRSSARRRWTANCCG